ncbi:hypothetical protein ABPG74_020279 [Tetrahymena malaccensis]
MKKFVILIFGLSQVGKDTWIQTFLNVKTNPGQGYHSVTQLAEKYSNQIDQIEYIVINVPGINDSNLRFENEFILQQIEAILFENNLTQIDAILLMESMVNAMSVLLCLDQLKRLFGDTVVQSILIVGSKQDQSEILGEFETRKTQIEIQASQLNLHVIFWKNFEENNIPNKCMESMVNAMSVLQCLDQLKRLFGDTVVQTILIVGCKKDQSEILGEFERRKTLMENQASQLFLPIIFWKNFQGANRPISNEVKTAQIDQIISKMRELSPYSVQKITELQEQIRQRVLILMEQTPKDTQRVTIQYTETIQVPYQDIEQFNQNYNDIEAYEDKQKVKKVRVVKKAEQKQEVYMVKQAFQCQKLVGGPMRIFGVIKSYDRYIDVPQIRNIQVQVDCPEEYDDVENVVKYKKVEKQRIQERQVTKYRPQNVQKSKEEIIEIPHDFNTFYERVKQERVKEIRDQINQNFMQQNN